MDEKLALPAPVCAERSFLQGAYSSTSEWPLDDEPERRVVTLLFRVAVRSAKEPKGASDSPTMEFVL